MSSAAVVVNYEPRGAALEMFQRSDREICLSGAAGTGKSVAVLMRLHLSCLATPGVRALVARKTHASLTASTLVTFRNMVAAEAIAAGLVKFYGGSGQHPAAFRYSNGSILVVGGLDRPSRLLSTEYDLCFIDEAVECSEEDLDTIVTRLRHGVLSRQQLLLATNPGAPTHHLKYRADMGRMVMLYSTHEDNPRMFQNGEWTEYGRTYLERLDSLTGVRYQRMRWGRWVAAEGAVFETFDPSHHVIDKFPIPPHWQRYMAVDFGYIHPFVCQWWALDEDGRAYLYREIYATKKTVDEHAKDILRAVADLPPGLSERDARPSQWIWREPKPRALICDHDAENRAVLERDLGMGSIAATKGVTDGIQTVQARLRKQGDGRARIFFMRDAVVQRDRELVDGKKPSCTIDEIPGYIWHQPNGTTIKAKELPVKDMDDGCLAAGTLVATGRGAVPIEQVLSGDTVRTRDGYKSVIAAGMTAEKASVFTVHLSDGKTLVGTGNHPIWVTGWGWKRLDALRYADKLETWQLPSGTRESPSAATPTPSSGQIRFTTPPASAIGSQESGISIKRSGRTPMGPFPRATRSTTSISTPTTTASKTWPVLPPPNTTRRTASDEAIGDLHLKPLLTSMRSSTLPACGTDPKQAGSGTATTPSGRTSAVDPRALTHASSVVPSTTSLASTDGSGFAPTSASPHGGVLAVSTMSSDRVPSAAENSPLTGTRLSGVAETYVLSVCEEDARVPVFNLTIAGTPEYFANGVLVHNCDTMRYFAVEVDRSRPRVRRL